MRQITKLKAVSHIYLSTIRMPVLDFRSLVAQSLFYFNSGCVSVSYHEAISVYCRYLVHAYCSMTVFYKGLVTMSISVVLVANCLE